MRKAVIIAGRIGPNGEGDTVRFATLNSLARRAAGRRGSWQVEHEPGFDLPRRTVMILAPVPRGNAYRVVARIRVDSEAIEEASSDA